MLFPVIKNYFLLKKDLNIPTNISPEIKYAYPNAKTISNPHRIGSLDQASSEIIVITITVKIVKRLLILNR